MLNFDLVLYLLITPVSHIKVLLVNKYICFESIVDLN